MDEGRLQQLQRKRASGLTDDEANELGRMIAERDGQPYGNATTRPHPGSLDETDDTPPSESEPEEVRHRPGVDDHE